MCTSGVFNNFPIIRPLAHWIDLESTFFHHTFPGISIVLFWRSYFCWWAKVKFIPCLYLENDTNCNAVYFFNGNIIKYSCIYFFCREIIVYSQNTINAYFLLSNEWWVPLIKFMVGPIIHVRGGTTHLWYSEST